MNLAQELLLCALDENGQLGSAKLPYGFGAAMLADLALRERLDLEGTITVLSAEPTGDAMLDRLLADAAQPGAGELTVSQLAGQIARAYFPELTRSLVEDGLATREQGEKRRLVGRKPDRTVPTAAGEEPRARARACLLGESAPDARTATLVAILAGCDLVGRLVPRDQRKAAEGRAEAAAEQAGVDEGLERAIKGAQLAVRTSTP